MLFFSQIKLCMLNLRPNDFPLTFEIQTQEAARAWKPEEDSTFSTYSAHNQWMSLWYWQKCKEDVRFCV